MAFLSSRFDAHLFMCMKFTKTTSTFFQHLHPKGQYAMSLAARTALYFKYSVSAKYCFTPAPTNAKEVRFIHDSFAKLGTIEHFSVSRTKHTEPHVFGQHVSVILNPSGQFSQLDPLTGIDTTIAPKAIELQHQQRKLHNRLRSLIGLPRYSYIEDDSAYFGGEVQVPFKHALVPGQLQLEGLYKMSTSTISSPFVYLEEGDQDAVTKAIRHNFQKYHKIQLVFVEDGMKGLHAMGAEPLDVSVKMDDMAVLKTDEIMDLSKTPAMLVAKTKEKGFHGFFSRPKSKV